MNEGWPHFIYLTGCDGTGKSTQAKALLARLTASDVKPRHLWLRFPFLLSLPVLLYARWRGHSWYEDAGGVRHGYWDFRNSRLLRLTLPWLLLIDATLAAVINIYLPLWLGKTIVCERFVLDMLADLAVAFDDPGLSRRLPGKLYPRLLPTGAAIVALDLDAATIRERRPDLRTDRRLETRLEVYRQLAADLGMPVIRSDQLLEEVSEQIRQVVMRVSGNKRKSYAVSRSPWLQPLLSNPVVALSVHWVFQGMTYMDRTERLFKLGIDLLLAVALFPIMLGWSGRWPWACVLAVGLAHTFNFLLNGQPWVVLKHFGRVRHSREEFEDYIAALTARAQAELSIAYLAVYGSPARGKWTPASDLDVRLVRQPGVMNALRACLLVLRERTRATFRRFPLDIYVLDSRAGLSKLRPDEPPRVLINRLNIS
ncbi:MAG: hypothetical protein HYZ49_09900 [Chloroflexi bacterium]|nr:hypothetical protein [Chloroflexota bacterium]